MRQSSRRPAPTISTRSRSTGRKARLDEDIDVSPGPRLSASG
jgi:hypothetical protein